MFSTILFDEHNCEMILELLSGVKLYFEKLDIVQSDTLLMYITIGTKLLLLIIWEGLLVVASVMIVAWVIRKIGIYGVEGGSYEREFLKQYEIQYIDELCDKIRNKIYGENGYQIKYATNKKFKDEKNVEIDKTCFSFETINELFS